MTWSEAPLGQLAEFRNGLNYTKENEGTGLRVVNVKDFGDRSVPDYELLGELNPQGILREEALLQDCDIIFVRSNGNKDLIGRSLLISHPPDSVSFSAFCIRARFHDQKHARFYSYFFRTPDFRKRLSLLGRGVNISNLNQQVLASIKVPCRAIGTMANIVSSIQPYDDLIENNRRRIQLLEQAARLLYKEWFVHLRFPGHEHVKITNGVPEGWSNLTLAEIAQDVSYGLTASACDEAIGPKFLRITDIVPDVIDWDRVPFCVAEQKKIEANRLMIGDVVVARTGATVGYAKFISHLPCETVYASYLIRFRFAEPMVAAIAGIYMESTAFKDFVRAHAGGAAQPNANATILGSATMLLPSTLICEQFYRRVVPIIRQKDALVQQNRALAKARDLLLPRLMNGEIPV